MACLVSTLFQFNIFLVKTYFELWIFSRARITQSRSYKWLSCYSMMRVPTAHLIFHFNSPERWKKSICRFKYALFKWSVNVQHSTCKRVHIQWKYASQAASQRWLPNALCWRHDSGISKFIIGWNFMEIIINSSIFHRNQLFHRWMRIL